MTAQNLYSETSSWAWTADADAMGAPSGALLRSDNLVPDEVGVVALRKGSSVIYSGLVPQRVHSLRTVVLDGVTYRMMGVDDSLFRNGVDFSFVKPDGTAGFDGTGDIVLGDDSFQVFAARGMTKKKFDGTTLNEWGIKAPVSAPTLQGITSIFATVATFASAESPAFTVNEGTGTFVPDYANVANNALRLTPSATTGRASASKIFATDTNLFAIGGGDGGDTDLFDIYVYLQEPRKAESLTIMFGLGTGADAYLTDYYYWDFKLPANLTGANVVNIKDSSAQAATIYANAAAKLNNASLRPQDVTNLLTPLEASQALKALGRFSSPRSKERRDISEASPSWTHFSVTRGQFSRIGGTAGRDWSTVKAFKVVYQAVPGSTETISFATAIIVGGGARSLTGKYTCGYRFVRDTGKYIELSPLSPVSTPIVLTQQALRVTIPSAAITAMDPQANQIWIYLFGGFLNTYLRIAVTSSTARSSRMRIDDFPAREGGVNMDTGNERSVVDSPSFAIPGSTPNLDVTIDILKSEADAINENEALEPGAIGPPDDIVAMAGPDHGRMFVATSDGWVYPSSDTSPSNFSVFWALDLRRWGTPLWMVKTNGGVLVGMTKDVVLIQGTGDVSSDQASIDLYPVALGIGNPPVDSCVFTDGNAVIYRACDDLMTLTGVSLTPVDQGKVSLLWRGLQRHGVSPLNLNGRFRIAISQHIMFMIAPEGASSDGSSAIWRYNNGKWSRTEYPTTFISIFKDPDGSVIAGTTDGALWKLEDTAFDNNNPVEANLLAPYSYGTSPLNRKDAFDLQLHVESDGNPGTVQVYLDGDPTPVASYPFLMVGTGVYRINVQEDLPPFFRAQIGITGSFGVFKLRSFNMTYRERPQMMMVLDTGTVLPDDPHEMSWEGEVFVDVISPVDLEIIPYMNDEPDEVTTIPITAPNRRSLYRVTFPRGLKGERPRFVLRTTNGNGNEGFECYSIRIQYRPTGSDQPEKMFATVWPAGQKS